MEDARRISLTCECGSAFAGRRGSLNYSCSTLALVALNLATKPASEPSVSQSLNIVYHSPAGL